MKAPNTFTKIAGTLALATLLFACPKFVIVEISHREIPAGHKVGLTVRTF